GALLVAAAAGALGTMQYLHNGADRQASQAVAPSAERVQAVRFFREPKAVPALDVTTIDGKAVSVESLRGKVVLINFWATSCPPCRAEIPDLIALQKKYADKLTILGLSEDEGGPAEVRKFADEFKMNYPIAMVTPGIEKMFPGVTGLPTTF